MKLARLTLILLAVAALFSCKKYDDGPALSLRTKENRLTSGKWVRVKAWKNGSPKEINSFPSSPVIRFMDKGEFYDEDQYSTNSREGYWNFYDKKSKLELTGADYTGVNFYTETWEILRLTNGELWYTVIDSSNLYEFHLEKYDR